MMEEKKTVFNYLSQTFATYGVIVLIFVLFSLIIGESAAEYSALFALGKEGISLPILAELLLLAVMITAAQVVFVTDVIIRNLSIVIRNVLLFVTVFIVMIIMIIIFDWFPTKDITAWMGFVISYAVSMFISVFITKLREHLENSKMQKALDEYNKGNN